jgi:hypothetical protein
MSMKRSHVFDKTTIRMYRDWLYRLGCKNGFKHSTQLSTQSFLSSVSRLFHVRYILSWPEVQTLKILIHFFYTSPWLHDYLSNDKILMNLC